MGRAIIPATQEVLVEIVGDSFFAGAGREIEIGLVVHAVADEVDASIDHRDMGTARVPTPQMLNVECVFRVEVVSHEQAECRRNVVLALVAAADGPAPTKVSWNRPFTHGDRIGRTIEYIAKTRHASAVVHPVSVQDTGAPSEIVSEFSVVAAGDADIIDRVKDTGIT